MKSCLIQFNNQQVGDFIVPNFYMNTTLHSTSRSIIPFLVFVFLMCGTAGLFCPMPASAIDTHHPHPTSHHSSADPNGECPEQLSNSSKPLNELNLAPCPFTHFHLFDPLPQPSIQPLWLTHAFQSSSYPLLFLRFSVLLN